jgi:hypothetical protein
MLDCFLGLNTTFWLFGDPLFPSESLHNGLGGTIVYFEFFGCFFQADFFLLELQ